MLVVMPLALTHFSHQRRIRGMVLYRYAVSSSDFKQIRRDNDTNYHPLKTTDNPEKRNHHHESKKRSLELAFNHNSLRQKCRWFC